MHDSSSLRLTLKTVEGDTVEVSLEAQKFRRSERSSARGRSGRISQRQETWSNAHTASVNVQGDLSDAELEDIRGLLQSLAVSGAPQAAEGDLDTIAEYQYSYQRTRDMRQARVEIYG